MSLGLLSTGVAVIGLAWLGANSHACEESRLTAEEAPSPNPRGREGYGSLGGEDGVSGGDVGVVHGDGVASHGVSGSSSIVNLSSGVTPSSSSTMTYAICDVRTERVLAAATA